MSITASPLSWPPGWKRTANRVNGAFRNGISDQLTIGLATGRLRAQLRMMQVREDDIIISTNLRLRLDGLPYSQQAQPRDPGAAVYWKDSKGKARCMAIDIYNKVEQNIAALAATLDALRTVERHGGAVVIDKAFDGFLALPAPIAMGDGHRAWHDVLGLDPFATEEEIRRAHQRLARQHHPDMPGGNPSLMGDINRARDEALQELKDHE
jgi:hypothetical protein